MYCSPIRRYCDTMDVKKDDKPETKGISRPETEGVSPPETEGRLLPETHPTVQDTEVELSGLKTLVDPSGERTEPREHREPGEPGELREPRGQTEPREHREPSEPREGTAVHTGPHDGALDQQRAIERQEHVANLLRFRQVTLIGVLIWPAFALVDLVVVYMIGRASLGVLLLIRAAPLPFFVWAVVRARRTPQLTPGQLRALDVSVFGVASLSIALMCVHFDGFRSLYFGGVALVIVCRSAFIVEPWKSSLLPNGLILGAYILTLFGSTLFYGPSAAQLGDLESMGKFVVHLAFLTSTAVLVGATGHGAWVLRRQVFAERNIGRYRLKHRIGKGGMGEVWAAYHTALKRDVALKLLRPDSGMDPATIQRFEREVSATAELTHPNTVRVFDYGVTEDGIWYYAMELLDGEDVGRLVKREGPLDPKRAVDLALQIARALAEAHLRAIVHRDIKPENIFVTRPGTDQDVVKVLDFGIAKVTQREVDGGLTRTGALMGTPAYMSPEAARSQPVDPRADVYSLGAVLYFMLTGQPPFDDASFAALVFAQIARDPEPPSVRRGEPLPEALEAIVLRCLEKNPEDRFEDAGAVAEALLKYSVAG